MKRPAPRRNAVAVVATMLVTFSLGVTLSVFVAGAASAASPTTTTTATATSDTTTTASPADQFFVINGTVNAASDHEIVGSSAFPNFTTGAIDNYYSMAHSHVDNSPFAEGTASPADTGPIGQTAAAGNFQQPQYADSRWPGDAKKATVGNQGGPYAVADAGEFRATAEASEATNALSGPSAPSPIAVPKGFDLRLKQALSAWKAKWRGLSPTKPTAPGTIPKPPLTIPKPPLTSPKAPITTPVATVTTPSTRLGGSNSPPPSPVPVPTPTVPSLGAAPPPRSMASSSTPTDGESLLESSTLATLQETTGTPKTDTTKTGTTKTGPSKSYTLVTSGESRLGRVSLGGGQIVIEGIHVTASISNDGTPTYKAAVSIVSASIGGVPVTIDQDGVHVSGQGGALPYQQATDALNGALKQAGIQLFLVAPEVTTSSNSCDQSGSGSGGGSGTSTTTTTTSTTSTTSTTTSSDQAGTGPMNSNLCDQSGMGTSCDQSGTGTGTGTTSTTTNASPLTTPSQTTTTTSSNQSSTTSTTSSCDYTGTNPSSSCQQPSTPTGTTTTSSSNQSSTTSTTDTTSTTLTSSSDQTGMDTGTPTSGEETVTATGLHVVFTQPVNQSGVPSQNVEHIFGEVFVDSLAVPGGPLPDLGFSSSSSSSFSSSSSSCLGGGRSGAGTSGASMSGSGSSLGGSSGSLSSSASGFGSSSQPGSSSTGNSLPAAFAFALRKPLWLLLAYVLWQMLVIGTGASLWNWRRGDAS